MAIDGARQRLAIFGQQGQQRGEIGAVPVTVDPRLGEADVAAFQHLVEDRPLGDLEDGGALAGGGLTKTRTAAVGQANFQAAVLYPFEQGQHSPGAARQCLAARGRGEAEGVFHVFIGWSPRVEVRVC
jgi:hypothetical protein